MHQKQVPIINRGVLIGHQTEIRDYVTIQPGANIAGACRIGEATYVGIGSVVIDYVTIGVHAVVGAGAVVTKNVPDNVQVVGVPARMLRKTSWGGDLGKRIFLGLRAPDWILPSRKRANLLLLRRLVFSSERGCRSAE